MQATRREILDILKRQAGSTVDELAKSLRLSPMCIRQHLALLERDGLVSPREVRRRTGRPHFFYTLTERSDGYFPKSYDKLAAAILSEIRERDGSERVGQLMAGIGQRLGVEYAQKLTGKAFGERLTAMVDIVGNGSGLGSWEKDGDSYVLRVFDCPYHKVSQQHNEVCNLHLRLLTCVLDAEVYREENLAQGDIRCTYRLQPREQV